MTQEREVSSITNTILLSVGLKGSTFCLALATEYTHFIMFLHIIMKMAIGLGNIGVFLAGLVAIIKWLDPSFRIHVAYRYWRGKINHKKKKP